MAPLCLQGQHRWHPASCRSHSSSVCCFSTIITVNTCEYSYRKTTIFGNLANTHVMEMNAAAQHPTKHQIGAMHSRKEQVTSHQSLA